MEFFKIPGAALLADEKLIFDEIKNCIDQATNDFLIAPDWGHNLRCVELIKPLTNQELLAEVSLVLRRKLRASQPKVVVLTLRLIESLTNNCSSSWYTALNDERMTAELGSVARKYVQKIGAENREVAEVCLDLVQAWGEAFLPKRKNYSNIVNLYFNLRKEGLPFKVNNQFDPNRVPIFAKSPLQSNEGYLDRDTDAILAASLQSVNVSESRPQVPQQPSSSRRRPSNSHSEEVIQSLMVSASVLNDTILAANDSYELRHNELAEEIIRQIQSSQNNLQIVIEQSMDDPMALERLFKLNDKAQATLKLYEDVKSGSISLAEAKRTLSLEGKPVAHPAAKHPSPSPTNDLLGMNTFNEPENRIRGSSPHTVPSNPGTPTHRSRNNSRPESPAVYRDVNGPVRSNSNRGPAVPKILPPPMPGQFASPNYDSPGRAMRKQIAVQPIPQKKEDDKIIPVDDPFSQESLDAMLETPTKRNSKELNPILDLFSAPPPQPHPQYGISYGVAEQPPGYPTYPPYSQPQPNHYPPAAYPPVYPPHQGYPPHQPAPYFYPSPAQQQMNYPPPAAAPHYPPNQQRKPNTPDHTNPFDTF